MATTKLVVKPGKVSVRIILGAIAVLSLMIFGSTLKRQVVMIRQGWAQQKLEKQIRTSAMAVVRPAPIPEVHEFMLKPGEGRMFKTNGARVEFRFYDGTTDVVLYTGEFAKRKFRHYSHSGEGRISSRQVRESTAIEFIRPPEAKTSLGYMVTIYREVTK